MVKINELHLPIIRNIFKFDINNSISLYRYPSNLFGFTGVSKYELKEIHIEYNVNYEFIIEKYINLLSHLNDNMCRYLEYLYSLYLNNRIIIYEFDSFIENCCRCRTLFIIEDIPFYYYFIHHQLFTENIIDYVIEIYNGEKYMCNLNIFLDDIDNNDIENKANKADKYYNLNVSKYFDAFKESFSDKKTYIEISKNLMINKN